MHVDKFPSVSGWFAVNLSFPAVCVQNAAIASQSGSEVPVEFRPSDVSHHVNLQIVNRQLPLREWSAHPVEIEGFDLFPPMLVALGMDERDIVRIRPDLRSQLGIGGVSSRRVLLDLFFDGGLIGLPVTGRGERR